MNRENNQGKPPAVTRRRVFYISGFDPKGPAYYHALYAGEAQKQAALNGSQITVGPARRLGRMATCWQIEARFDGTVTQTDYEFLRWDDIMRRHMRQSRPPFFIKMIRTYWLYLSTGTLWRILKIGYPPFVAGMYPVIFMLAMALAALAVCLALSWVLVAGLGLPRWPSVIIAVAVFAATLWLGRRLEKTVPYLWPVHVYNFAADQAAGRVGEIDERIDGFARRIADYVASSDDDEVLIVGHSNGTTVAVSALARALRLDPDIARHGPTLSLLTLGESILLLSLLPQAGEFRRELQLAGSDNGVGWIDLTAPRDGACFALVDPLAASGLQPLAPPAGPKPKLLSIAMTDLFSPETWHKSIKRHWQRIHFQYLMAYEKPTPYDYFAITAGPLRLFDRYRAFPAKHGFDKFKLFGK